MNFNIMNLIQHNKGDAIYLFRYFLKLGIYILGFGIVVSLSSYSLWFKYIFLTIASIGFLILCGIQINNFIVDKQTNCRKSRLLITLMTNLLGCGIVFLVALTAIYPTDEMFLLSVASTIIFSITKR